MDETGILLAAALTAALVQGAKQTGLPARWSVLASVALGIAMAALIADSGIRAIILGGIISGLSASGLYSGAKAIAGPVLPVRSAGSAPADHVSPETPAKR